MFASELISHLRSLFRLSLKLPTPPISPETCLKVVVLLIQTTLIQFRSHLFPEIIRSYLF